MEKNQLYISCNKLIARAFFAFYNRQKFIIQGGVPVGVNYEKGVGSGFSKTKVEQRIRLLNIAKEWLPMTVSARLLDQLVFTK